jgi:prolyl oligopeptidase
MERITRFAFVVVLLATTLVSAAAQPYRYPPSRHVDVVENYHGTMVADPYRWMEDESSAELKTWIEAQNTLTFGFLENIPERARIKARLTELWNFPRYSVPFKRGNQYFYSKNDGLQNQSVVYRQETLESPPTTVIDPNLLSDDGTVALVNQSYTRDGSLLAYGISRSGSDWQEIRVRDVATGKDFDDVIKWCKFTGIAWTHDKKGFFYNRYPEPGTVPPEEGSYHVKVYWHALGTSQAEDKLVFERPDAKELGYSPFMTEDGKYLVLYVWRGTDPVNGLYYREVGSSGDFVRLIEIDDASFNFIDNVGTTFYLRTNLDAPRGRIIAVDVTNPERKSWKEILPQQDEPISFVASVGNRFVVAFMKDAHHQLKVYEMNGTYVRSIELPTMGTVSGLSGRRNENEMFFGFASFLFPTSIYRYDVATNTVSLFRGSELSFDPSPFETRQVFYRSKDGTRIPMFLTHKKSMTLDGHNPVLLYGYGGFNVNMLPSFSVSRLAWLEHGGVYAHAILRGGSEYGEEWHRAGMLEKKQNVFDDFIAAAEWLVDNGYTSPSRLAIMGGSNGGLLVGACMLQRPELFGAVICQVPVTDMLRYHKFTVGRFWVGEYGNAEQNPDHFKFMYAYSPLHNVKPGVAHPATLITTADHDDRVVPAHAMKFAATLQAADAGKNPILIRVETKAGHGGGKPISKQIDEAADTYAFLMKVLGMSTAGSQ